MKVRYSLATVLFILLCFAGCSSETKDSLQQQVGDLQSEKEVVSQDVCNLSIELEELHLSPLDDGFQEDMQNRKYMTVSDVVIRKAPVEREEFNTDMKQSYSMIRTVYAIYTMGEEPLEDRIWVLVQCVSSEPEDTVGWVKWKELTEYTEENKHLLTSPICVSEEAIDLYTGEIIAPLLCNGGWLEWEDDYAIVHVVGGKSCKVEKEYLIYPTP